MAGSIREVKGKISSVGNMKQITSVMKLIAAANLKKARYQLEATMPFYEKVKNIMADILMHTTQIDNIYFHQRDAKKDKKSAYFIITGDKGLAGSYNNNIIKLAKQHVDKSPESLLMVAGQVGRNHFLKQKYNVDASFNYPVQKPSIIRAREISNILLELFRTEQVDRVYLIYTKMNSTIELIPQVVRLFPMQWDAIREDLNILPASVTNAKGYGYEFEYEPSVQEVFNVLVPKYVDFMIYFALVQSSTSEQSARMTAMDNATTNAEEILKKLQLDYNRARQFAITQEILEVIGGATAIS